MNFYRNNSLNLILVVSFFLLLSGCEKSSLCEEKEVLRKTSPDNIVDALLVQVNCGATANYSYQVFLVPMGSEATEYPLFLADNTSNINLSWIASKELLISYDKARIFEFKNFWQIKQINEPQYLVSIIELKNTIRKHH